jgi:hypothetical protein
MVRQVTVTLSESEYARLSAEAGRRGEAPESLLQRTVSAHIGPDRSGGVMGQPPSKAVILEHLYRAGVITAVPSPEPVSPEQAAERERLAQLFGQGRPVSELIIEDRGAR